MKNRHKGLIAISIFLVLFSGGWVANEFNNHRVHEKGLDGFETLNVDDDRIVPTVTPFGPREYIRIGKRNQLNE
ncbi:hypothetical protein [Bacillus suaedae]|uniref:Uncharacterized protein n=1 Tax=Halalkalibacter suaedae TaxID=2822140 RepID=A0A941APC4_9BACI|nr:hypothetical protein [Bacillus suaedae]MBP3951342.1 hypothetical protein [Bacillus suaedae]